MYTTHGTNSFTPLPKEEEWRSEKGRLVPVDLFMMFDPGNAGKSSLCIVNSGTGSACLLTIPTATITCNNNKQQLSFIGRRTPLAQDRDVIGCWRKHWTMSAKREGLLTYIYLWFWKPYSTVFHMVLTSFSYEFDLNFVHARTRGLPFVRGECQDQKYMPLSRRLNMTSYTG